ncbi:UxaA family hydrolase [Sphingobacterium humi]|uniref:Altronate dehydratase n=1 Tax=Sphingobacterium humi TaxID=1796905 RepID=A0A6N8KXS6_9SPHI|nr:altronate dehydratase family protein [Sphingobacterium humi]MVZ61041.1 altronate dehydratase [Sphingobacterium humi]
MKTIKLEPQDNVIVALSNLSQGSAIETNADPLTLLEDIPAKHKVFEQDMAADQDIIMYGVRVGKTTQAVKAGARMSTENSKHATDPYQYRGLQASWQALDVSKYQGRTFQGYHRPDGRVGTANYWLFIPTVFCENRNMDVIKAALLDNLGYNKPNDYQDYVQSLIHAVEEGESLEQVDIASLAPSTHRVFQNIDGIKFLNHQGGCGGTRQDAQSLGKLLASYIDHPNVAGATILGLGCENLQMQDLFAELEKRNPNLHKPILRFEQQKTGTEQELIKTCLLQTFKALKEVNKQERQPAGLDKLVLGVKCGGSDGFSGISANPAVGYAADLLVSLGGSVLLAEFPELCGAEQQLLDRMDSAENAEKFIKLMELYSQSAEAVGSGFHMNPSPGNIRDGLITDAMKSNGAAKKGGNSPVADVLEYTEPVKKAGLNLVCTPGNDVEATTGKAASGATLILFTTGLGTPTGNPICPTIKVATNNQLAARMPDIIDINSGSIIDGSKSIAEVGEEILDYCIAAASGTVIPKAVQLQQDDFIPWKRGISL